jgi:ferredoxin/flavodoxin---NADP+ reductase
MMRAVCNLTKEYGIKTIVSMNPIMIDGTGMCGGCRLTVGGKTKFACVTARILTDMKWTLMKPSSVPKHIPEMEKKAAHDYKCHLMESVDNA